VKAPAELDTLIALLTAPRIEDRLPTARHAAAELVRILKKAPSLANGDRGVRARIGNVMGRLYPAEPAKSRAELGRLIALSRNAEPKPETGPLPSPAPGPADESLLPGTRYRILRELGRGAMGVVYEATHVDLGRVVALKVLPKERCLSTEHELRFRQKPGRARACVTRTSFNCNDFRRRERRAPLLRDGSFSRARRSSATWSASAAWTFREAIRVGVETCGALECAHAAGLVHRDIKPGNVFLTRDGKVKLLDFGLVMSEPEAAPARSRGAEADRHGRVHGAGAGRRRNRRRARGRLRFGAVLYELITGRLPHVAPTNARAHRPQAPRHPRIAL